MIKFIVQSNDEPLMTSTSQLVQALAQGHQVIGVHGYSADLRQTLSQLSSADSSSKFCVIHELAAEELDSILTALDIQIQRVVSIQRNSSIDPDFNNSTAAEIESASWANVLNPIKNDIYGSGNPMELFKQAIKKVCSLTG